MPRTIQIRNVPDDVRRRLEAKAARAGVTLSELLEREARRLAEEPTIEEMRQRLLSLPRRRLKTSPATMVREVRGR